MSIMVLYENETEVHNLAMKPITDLAFKSNLSENDNSLKIKSKVKKDVSNTENSCEKKYSLIKEVSINNLWTFVILSVIVYLYFLNICDAFVEKDKLFKKSKFFGENEFIYRKGIIKKKERVLAEPEYEECVSSVNIKELEKFEQMSIKKSDSENTSDNTETTEEEETTEEDETTEDNETTEHGDTSDNEDTSNEEDKSGSSKQLLKKGVLQKDKRKDWTFGLIENTILICNDYLRMVKELREGIFISNLVFNRFLYEMRKKKFIVEAHAPQILNKHESGDIRRAKILQYYKEFPQNPSELNRLEANVMHYNNLLDYFQAIRQARDEDQERSAVKATNKYQAILDYCDPRAGAESKRRLQHLMDQYESYSNKDEESIFKEEKQIFYSALYLCHNYREILERISMANPITKNKLKKELYMIEKELASIIPGFYYLYKWENTLGPEIKNQDTGFSAKRFRSMHHFFNS